MVEKKPSALNEDNTLPPFFSIDEPETTFVNKDKTMTFNQGDQLEIVEREPRDGLKHV